MPYLILCENIQQVDSNLGLKSVLLHLGLLDVDNLDLLGHRKRRGEEVARLLLEANTPKNTSLSDFPDGREHVASSTIRLRLADLSVEDCGFLSKIMRIFKRQPVFSQRTN